MVAARQDMDRYCFDKAQELDADWLVPLEAARVELYYRRPSKALSRIRRALESAPDAALCLVCAGNLPGRVGTDAPRQERVFSIAWSLVPVTPTPRSNCPFAGMELVADEDSSPTIWEMTTNGLDAREDS